MNLNKSYLFYGLLYLITGWIIFSIIFGESRSDLNLNFLLIIITIFATTLVTKYVKVFLFMLIAPWYDIWKQGDDHTWEIKNPRVSILIPAYNEEVGLLSTVQSIIANTYRDIEIIVVNDGSKDNSDEMMRNFIKNTRLRKGIRLKYFYKENGGKGKALNYALERSTGDIIMSIDADCILTPETVQNFVKRFNNPSVMAAVGNVKVGNTENPITMLQKLEFQFSFYWKKAESVLGIIYIIGGAAGAFRREVFETFGGYDVTSITEDIDLSVKLQEHGFKAVYADDAIVYTEGASTLKGLVKQRTRWKYGWIMTFAHNSALLFSFKKKHNKLLGWGFLPLTYVNNVMLFLEPWMVIILYVYCTLIGDYSFFITWIILESMQFFVHAIFDDPESRKVSFFALSPISWLLFHISTYVEYRALIGSLWDIILKREATWGVWTRTGVGITMDNSSSHLLKT